MPMDRVYFVVFRIEVSRYIVILGLEIFPVEKFRVFMNNTFFGIGNCMDLSAIWGKLYEQ